MTNAKQATVPADSGYSPLVFGLCVGASVPITRRLLIPMIWPGLNDTVIGMIATAAAVGFVGGIFCVLLNCVLGSFRTPKPSNAGTSGN